MSDFLDLVDFRETVVQEEEHPVHPIAVLGINMHKAHRHSTYTAAKQAMAGAVSFLNVID